ncbi:783_t:CDS:2, partial [Rhizophagus irregularis]
MITVPHTFPHTPPPSNFFLCSTCERQFKSSRDLTQHTRVIKKYNQRQVYGKEVGSIPCPEKEINPLEQLIHQQSKNYKKTRRPKFLREEILVEWKKRVSREINGNLCTAG